MVPQEFFGKQIFLVALFERERSVQIETNGKILSAAG